MAVSRLAPLTPDQAGHAARVLERRGWRAEACTASFGRGYVEVRDLAMRHTPLVTTLRTPGDVDDFNAAHPEHGLIGRHPRCTGATG